MSRIKWIAYGLLALLVCFGVGYAFGRYAVPERVVESTVVEIVEIEKERIVVVEKQVVERVYIQSESQSIRRNIREVEHPDGTKEKETTEEIDIDKVVHTTEVQVVEVEVEKERIVVVENQIETERLVELARPDWTVTPMVGLDFRNVFQDGLRDSVVYGAAVERRIMGPVSVGAWGTTAGVAGVSVSLELW